MKQFKTIFIGVMISLLLSSAIAYAAVPNLVGQWKISSKTVCYENIFNPGEVPVFGAWSATLIITVQNGRVFAGYIDAGDYKIKVTGAISPDKKVKMQLYGDNNRDFFSGELTVINMTKNIIGLANSFEEITLAQEPSICTAYVVLTKVIVQ